MNADPADFIQAETRLLPVPLCPEILLYTADEATALWQRTEDALGALNLPPPFWAFPWAGGQALARYILDKPALVAGKRVLDVGSGSGLVAIAAARAKAAHVMANDIDPVAMAAAGLNAAANGTALQRRGNDMVGSDEGWDVVLAGDIAYQADMAARLFPWLQALARRGATVLLGDPRRAYLPRDLLRPLAHYDVPVPRSLEDAEIKPTDVWTFRRDGGPAVSP